MMIIVILILILIITIIIIIPEVAPIVDPLLARLAKAGSPAFRAADITITFAL